MMRRGYGKGGGLKTVRRGLRGGWGVEDGGVGVVKKTIAWGWVFFLIKILK